MCYLFILINMTEKTYVVYLIRYRGKVKYVGKTDDFSRRKRQHTNLIGTTESALPKRTDITKIEFEILGEYMTKNDALVAEETYINQYDTINNGWNKNHSGFVLKKDTKEYHREYDKKTRNQPKRKKQIAKAQKRYYEKNKEKILAYQKEWRKNKRINPNTLGI